MATTAMATVRSNVFALSTIALAVTSATNAGEFEFTPKFTLEETYSDNVELTRHNEISSLVSQAGVLLDLDYQSKNLQWNWRSSSKYAFFSHDHDQDGDYHDLESSIAYTLWPNGITLIASADISNQSRDTTRNAFADIVSGDTVQVERYTSGIQYNANNSDFIINSSANYLVTEAEDGLGEQEGWQAAINSKNGVSARIVFWDLNANIQDTKNNQREGKFYQGEVKLGLLTPYKINPFLRYYDEETEGTIGGGRLAESNSYGAGLRWLITPRLRFDLSYNKPVDDGTDIDGNALDNYWDAQLEWQPSSRTQLTLGTSERFYGDSYHAEFSHRNKRLTNSISYVEEVQTFTRNNFTQFSVGSFWCPDDFGTDLNQCFVADGQDIDVNTHQLITVSDVEVSEDDVFSLNKNLQWVSELALPRTTFTFELQASERENLDTRVKDEIQTAKITAKRKLSGRSSVNFNMSFSENHYQIGQEGERKDRYRNYLIAYEKDMNSRLSADFSLSYINRSSDNFTLNYKEGRVGFVVTKEF
ncbi:TIGR03016 family PEP-CTERM system-associated outer membrane protein [Thalassotalea fusca]